MTIRLALLCVVLMAGCQKENAVDLEKLKIHGTKCVIIGKMIYFDFGNQSCCLIVKDADNNQETVPVDKLLYGHFKVNTTIYIARTGTNGDGPFAISKYIE